MKLLVKNADVVTADRVLACANCVVSDGTIAAIGSETPLCDQTIDGEGCFLLPGFIDLHCHGGGSYDFMDADPDEYERIERFHLSHGTTTMLATTMADDMPAVRNCLAAFAAYKKRRPDGTLAGVHLEGPWFSPAQCGAQPPAFFRDPDETELEGLKREFPFILRVSAAPELPGGWRFGEKAAALGVVASAGHTDADFGDIERAAAHGYTLMTHLYSGMKGVTRKNAYRVAGAVEAGLYLDSLNVEIIADGRHLPDELLRFVYACKGPDRICLITDGTRACGLPEQTLTVTGSRRNGTPAVVEDGVAKLLDRSGFAGSAATADRLFGTMARAIGRDMPALSKMASLTPAKVMGFRDRGEIAPGKRADLVLMDKTLCVKHVILNGGLV